MYNNNLMQNRARLIVWVVGTIIIGLIVWYSIIQVSHIGKVPVTVETAPKDMTIKIDGRSANTGVNYIIAGTHTFEAKKTGYETARQTVSVDTLNNYVALIPNPVSDEANKESESEDVSALAETISGTASSIAGGALRTKNPIIKKLPVSNISGPYKIDYGYNYDDSTKLYLIISYASPNGRQKALHWLKENNVNLTTQEIVFDGFANPILRSYHD